MTDDANFCIVFIGQAVIFVQYNLKRRVLFGDYYEGEAFTIIMA